jgi:hypothetical protein
MTAHTERRPHPGKTIVAAGLFLTLLLNSCGGDSKKRPADPETVGLAAADFILSLQNADGRILDCPDSDIVNEDSNMEYACIGLAAAYKRSGDSKYLDGLAKAIDWLAAREEMLDADWRGSWYYAYGVNAPYDPFPVSPGDGISDARAVDATSALFVYILYLHKTLSGDASLANLYQDNACAALDFLLAKNYDGAKYFYSSWQKSSGTWSLWDYRYAADQADVYLGLRAGFELFGTAAYGDAADVIAANVAADFFHAADHRFATGMENDGNRDTGFEEFNTIFPQGYIPWVFGTSTQADEAFVWLESKRGADGGLKCFTDDPGYSLSAAIFVMAARSLGKAVPESSLDWIALKTCDADDGGIRDTKNHDSEKFSNVAGFTAAAMLGFDPF